MWWMVLFWDFLLGVVENLEHKFWCFWGVILGVTLAAPYRCCACGSGASLSRLGNIYFGRGYREDCVIGLI